MSSLDFPIVEILPSAFSVLRISRRNQVVHFNSSLDLQDAAEVAGINATWRIGIGMLCIGPFSSCPTLE